MVEASCNDECLGSSEVFDGKTFVIEQKPQKFSPLTVLSYMVTVPHHIDQHM